MKVIQKLVADPHAYLESAGRNDRASLAVALQEGGQGTVIRACLWRGCC